jgi:hypothetical protein
MSIFGESNDDYIDDANDSIEQGYNEAAGYEEPYTEYGSQDFDSARNYLYKSLGGRKDYNSGFTKYLGMSPSQMLDQAMEEYSQSPLAQEEMSVSSSAVNNAATASGMGGSGDNELASAEIGNTIMNQDESNYMNELLKTFGIQGDILQGYDKQTKTLGKAFQDMLGTEEGSSNAMAGNAMKEGQYEAEADERGSQDAVESQRNHFHEFSQGLNDLFSLAGIHKANSLFKY